MFGWFRRKTVPLPAWLVDWPQWDAKRLGETMLMLSRQLDELKYPSPVEKPDKPGLTLAEGVEELMRARRRRALDRRSLKVLLPNLPRPRVRRRRRAA